MVGKRKPHFFKVLMGGEFNQKLRIPPKFMKYIEAPRSRRKAILQGPNGSNWETEIRTTAKGVFLSSGWTDFVKGHDLKEHEFLVFRYNGDMHFSVQVFDTTACERENLFATKTPTKLEPHKTKSKDGTHKKRQILKSALPELLEDHKHGNCPNPIQGNETNIKIENNALPIPTILPRSHQQTLYVSSRRPVTAEERSRTQDAANSFSSNFPCAIQRMTVYNVYKQYTVKLPNLFARAHLPQKRCNMVLRDPSGKSWVVSYYPCDRERARLSGGWSAFARGNNLEDGDFCAFELVGPVEMRVHIFRVVEELTPILRVTREKNS